MELCKSEDSTMVNDESRGGGSENDGGASTNGETLVQLHAVSALANLSCVPGSEPQLVQNGVLPVVVASLSPPSTNLLDGEYLFYCFIFCRITSSIS